LFFAAPTGAFIFSALDNAFSPAARAANSAFVLCPSIKLSGFALLSGIILTSSSSHTGKKSCADVGARFQSPILQGFTPPLPLAQPPVTDDFAVAFDRVAMDASWLMIVFVPKLWITSINRRVYVVYALRNDSAPRIQMQHTKLMVWLCQIALAVLVPTRGVTTLA
jgi:hypothetical protein